MSTPAGAAAPGADPTPIDVPGISKPATPYPAATRYGDTLAAATVYLTDTGKAATA